jgi:hypothetical protein
LLESTGIQRVNSLIYSSKLRINGGDVMNEISSDVEKAIVFLIEKLDEEIEKISRELEENSRRKDFEIARLVSEDGEFVKKVREKILEIQEEWTRRKKVHNVTHEAFPPKNRISRNITGKLRKGLKTSEASFYIPILESLVELGGKAAVKDVLKKVYEKMKDRLNEYDLQPLKSKSHEIRWVNTAQWARLDLVKEGLLNPESPHGIWEITGKGIEYLKKLKTESK